MLYRDPVIKMKNNEWIFFKKCRTPRGIKQGCPLSALLFRIVAEISATKLDSNENIVRFRIND